MTSQQQVCVPEGYINVLYRFFCYITFYVTRNVLYSMLYSICYKGQVFSLYNVIYYIKMVI